MITQKWTAKQLLTPTATLTLYEQINGGGYANVATFASGSNPASFGNGAAVFSGNGTILALNGNLTLNGNGVGIVQIGGGPGYITGTGVAGQLRFGFTDAATAVAQATFVQSVAAGNANTPGALWSIYDSAGNGSGVSGGFSFFTHPEGAASGTQNTPVLALNIGTAGAITLATSTYTSCTALTTNGSGVIGCTASDPRLKDIEGLMTDGMDAIRMVTPIIFRGKIGNIENVDTREQAGFNCWNVAAALPLGTHEDAKGYCNLDPMAISAALVNGEKNLDARLSRLESAFRGEGLMQ